jgi:hypothetical protein
MDRSVTKQTRDGRTVTISAVIKHTVAWAQAVLDGKVVASGKPGVIPAIPGRPEFTHGLGRVALTADEFTAVCDLIDAAQAEYDATPEGRFEVLSRQRERLVAEAYGAVDDAADDKAAAFDADELERYLVLQEGEDETRIAHLSAAVRVFDREHPEVLAALRAELRKRADDAMTD